MSFSMLAKLWHRSSTWRSEGSRRNSDLEMSRIPNEQIQDNARPFITSVTGRNLNFCSTNHSRTYIEYVKSQIHKPAQLLFCLNEILVTPRPGKEAGTEAALMLLHHVADVARTVEEPSIDHIIEEVVSLGIISGEALKVIRLHNIARSIVFCCVGWISMLFTPVWSEPSAKLSSDFLVFDRSHGPVELISQSQPIGIARSSLGEMMRTFGQLLPCQTAQTSNAGTDAAFASDSFYVSLLNVSTLSNIASIKIKWITHLSSHLRFDKNNRTLSIFALPSFCEVSRTHASDSGNSAPSSIVESYYDDFTKPTDFSNDALLREITRSYRLIFADDERSRRRYLNHERKRLIKYKMVHDPYLQDCCVGYQPGHRIAPTSYHKKHDFPIFEARLSELQEYVQRQNPSTIKMLWNDQRNFLQWVTLWAVVVVGSLGILFAFVQTTLSAVQVYIAANPPKM